MGWAVDDVIQGLVDRVMRLTENFNDFYQHKTTKTYIRVLLADSKSFYGSYVQVSSLEQTGDET